MKTNNLIKASIAAALMTGLQAHAESQYPAADFQPVIISQDSALISKHAEATKSSSSQEPSKPSMSSSSSSSASSYSSSKTVSAPVTAPKEESNLPLILAGVGVAAAAFWFMKKGGNKSAATPVASAPIAAQAPAASGATGVARYVEQISSSAPTAASASKTGVQRYVETLPAAAPAKAITGVEKYIKSLPASAAKAAEAAPAAAQKAATGVERYIGSLPQAAKPASDTGVAKYLKANGLAA